MNFKNIQAWPLTIATAVGGFILLIVSIVSNLISRNMLRTMFQGNMQPDPALMVRSWGISVAACFLAIAVTLGTGILYAILAARPRPPEQSDAALGGAIAGGVAYGLASLVGGLLTVAFLPDFMTGMMAPGGPAAVSAQIIMLAGGFIGALIGGCIALVFGGVLGGASGYVTAYFQRRGGADSG